ncbi:MAG: hypothetical protein M3Z66_11655 [Chloroflexota bacterium]|nr:hypothetical protein [Chloroflexota bacterium]
MIRALSLGAVLVGALTLPVVSSVGAALPPPPPPPECHVCSGPPPPPTLIPTVAVTLVPVEQSVAVRLSPTHVRRGHHTKVQVIASSDDAVTEVMRFREGKSITYRAKVGASGTLLHSCKIPETAPLGKAVLTVSVRDADKTVVESVSFLVTK